MMRAFLGALMLLSALSLSAQAELLEADLRVNGLTCPFCAFGIEKKLRAVEGVQKVNVLLDEGIVELVFAPGNAATVRALEEAVERAGFKLAGLRITVQGRLLPDASPPTLDAGSEAHFLLLEEKDGEKPRPIEEGTKGRIVQASASGTVVIEGAVHRHGDSLPGLIVERFEAIQ